MVDRILISPNRVAISRPGYDVKTAPISPDYLSVDSSFGMPLRIITAGVVAGVSIVEFPRVYYGTTYSSYPFAYVLPFEQGGASSTIYNFFQKWGQGSIHPDLYFNPYHVKMAKSYFYIARGDGYEGNRDDAFYFTPRNWLYIVFPP